MRPVFLYDAACGFCRRWVARWSVRADGRVRFRAGRRRTRRSSLYIASGRSSGEAEAMFRLFRKAPGLRTVGLVGLLPGVRLAANLAYRFIARHRVGTARMDRLLFGHRRALPSTTLVRWLFLRCLGLIFFAAFLSLQRQALGLYGRDGITPLDPALRDTLDRRGPSVMRRLPSLLWFGASDRRIMRLIKAGELASLSLFLNLAPRASLTTAWASYLSFTSVGGDFMQFQWDSLLLETGASALLVTPGGVLPGIGKGRPSAAGTWLMRWLVFRLHFESGIAKLQSGDKTWRNGTACTAYYETAPLPTRFGWRVHHLPPWFQKFSTAMVLYLECVAPFLGLLTRRPRRWAFAHLMFLQSLIFATGNYGFFNLLSAADTLWLLDDEDLWPSWAREQRPTFESWPSRVFATVGAAALLGLSVLLLWSRLRRREPGRRIISAYLKAAPYSLVNQYGLFSVMTTRRPEILIEGSRDGEEWNPYEFRFKPGDPKKPPQQIAPHMPRLDWMMWFAALGRQPAWFSSFLVGLLQGRPKVLELMGRNPFPDAPPKYVRARLYDYRMTDLETRRRTGEWWQRKFVSTYFPTLQLRTEPYRQTEYFV